MYAHSQRPIRVPGADPGPKRWVDEEPLGFPSQASYLPNYQDGLNNFIQDGWISEAMPSWNAADTTQSLWSHAVSPAPLPFDVYGGAEPPSSNHQYSRTNAIEYDSKVVSNAIERRGSRPDSQVHENRLVPSYEGESNGQTPEGNPIHSPINRQLQFQTTSYTELMRPSPPASFNASLESGHHSPWHASFPEDQGVKIPASISSGHAITSVPNREVKLDWSNSGQPPINAPNRRTGSYPPPVPKRKRDSPQPTSKKSRSEVPGNEFSQFVLVFENAPGALATVKHRRKLDAPVRKAARDVRKAGACHQCRFRKRTCSTGTPCISCLKHGNGIHEIKCQRESPFVGKMVHEYFQYSSTRRVVNFDISISRDCLAACEQDTIIVDGVGRISHPIRLKACRNQLKNFSSAEQTAIRGTEDRKHTLPASTDDAALVTVLVDEGELGRQLEQWAVEYTSRFVHAAGPAFYSTTIAQILGIAYVKKGLPESALVETMVRVAALAFVLRAGIKCSPSQLSSRFRTIQAKIDTILYQRLIVAEKELFQMLQRLIFRTAGCLNRESIYPVALVLWQLIRILCISSSHLSNIARKFHSTAHGQADYQFITLRLVLSTHMALFRTSNPLLLDLNEKPNQDLLNGDAELMKLAAKMRKVVLTFRKKGFPEMKGSIVYKKEYFDMFRKVYDGM